MKEILFLIAFSGVIGVLLKVVKLTNMFGWVATWWLGTFLFLKFGFTAPLPVSIISEYMTIVSLSLAVYTISSKERLEQVRDPLIRFVSDEKYAKILMATVVLLPLLVALQIYMGSFVKIQPPFFGRTVHPAPPTTIDFKGETIDLIKGENPYRKLETENPDEYKKHVTAGKKVYYQNCFFCHGDSMEGNGPFAYALDPIPTNFADPATIAMLQENFLFWRIAKGGIGLPTEGGPWASAMPAWENFLSSEDIWNVIIFLYDYTEQKPRAQEHHE